MTRKGFKYAVIDYNWAIVSRHHVLKRAKVSCAKEKKRLRDREACGVMRQDSWGDYTIPVA